MAQAKDQFLTLRQASSSALTSSSPTCDLRAAARLAARLFGCYRASDANNPGSLPGGGDGDAGAIS